MFERARRLTFGLLSCLRLHLTSNAICASGRQFVDWSADYRRCSRSPWDPHQLFAPVFDRLPALLPSPTAPVIAALDDTLCKKTGRQIPGVTVARDPLCRLLFMSTFVMDCVSCSCPCWLARPPLPALHAPCPYALTPLPAIKPKKNAAPEVWEAYRQEKKQRTLPRAGVQAMASLRQSLDERSETRQRQLIVSGDSSYTNRTVLRNLPERTIYLGRIRKDAKLHLPLPPDARKTTGRPRRYGPLAPTPEQILKDDSIPVLKVQCFAAGQLREIPVKVLPQPLYWRKAGPDIPFTSSGH